MECAPDDCARRRAGSRSSLSVMTSPKVVLMGLEFRINSRLQQLNALGELVRRHSIRYQVHVPESFGTVICERTLQRWIFLGHYEHLYWSCTCTLVAYDSNTRKVQIVLGTVNLTLIEKHLSKQ